MKNIDYLINNESDINANKKYTKMVYLACLLIYILFLCTIKATYFLHYEPNALHYLFNLSWHYWIGLFLLLVIIFLDEKLSNTIKHVRTYQIFVIVLFIIYMYGIVTFTYAYPRSLDSYMVMSWIEFININGLSNLPTPIYLSSFPGSIIYFATVSEIARLNSIYLAKFASILVIFLLSLISYITYYKLTGKYRLLPAIFFIPFTWVQEYHLLPQSFTLVFTAILIYLIIFSYLRQQIKEIIFLAIILIATITISHPLTPILNIISYITLLISIIIIPKLIHAHPFGENIFIKKNNHRFIKIIICFTSLLLIIQLIYYSEFMVCQIFDTITTNMNNIINMQDISSHIAVRDRYVSTPHISYLIGYYFRFFLIFFVLFGGIIISLFILVKYKFKNTHIILFGLFFGYILFSIGLGIAGYGIYGMDRGYIFSIIPFSLLSSFLVLNSKQKNVLRNVIIFLLIISIIIFPITKYASDPYNFTSESQMSMNNFNINSPTGHYSITNIKYNFIQLKTQRGEEYRNIEVHNVSIFYNNGDGLLYFSNSGYVPQLGKTV